MTDRLLQFIKAENLTQSEFAERIGVAGSSISHILSGRNKPGFDFIERMVRSFPALNVEWLITGRGRMYKNVEMSVSPAEPSTQSAESPADNGIFPELKAAPASEELDKPAPRISGIIIIYDDGTYREMH